MSASEPDFEDREQYMLTTTQSDNEMTHSEEPISDDLETDSSSHSMTLDSARTPADIPVEKYPDPSGRCIISCSRKSDRNMIRCISCMMWAHCTCVGEKADYQGVWSCFLCQNSSSKINFLVNQISSLKHEFLSKLKICEKKYTEINLELQNLRETNSDLVLQLQNSHKEIQRLKSKDDNTTPATQTTTKSLVIGDSILRDFEATDANKLEVRSLSGATFISIKDTLKLYESDNKRYDNIYIIAGTNDCSKQSSTASIINAAGEVFNQAKKISNNILFSSITPRTDNGPANLKVQNVNLSLKNLCSQSNVKFIDNDGTFLTSDKSPNDALLLDGLHLNDRGTTKLITNLGIKASPKKRRPKQTTRINNNNYIPPLLPTNYNQALPCTYGSQNYSSQKPQHTPPSSNNLPGWNQQISWSDQQRAAWTQPMFPWNQTPSRWNQNITQWNHSQMPLNQHQAAPSYLPQARYCLTCRQHGHSTQECPLGNYNNQNHYSQNQYF